MRPEIALDHHPLLLPAFCAARRLAERYYPATPLQKRAHFDLLAALDIGDLGALKEAMRRAAVLKPGEGPATREWAHEAYVWRRLVERRIEAGVRKTRRQAA